MMLMRQQGNHLWDNQTNGTRERKAIESNYLKISLLRKLIVPWLLLKEEGKF